MRKLGTAKQSLTVAHGENFEFMKVDAIYKLVAIVCCLGLFLVPGCKDDTQSSDEDGFEVNKSYAGGGVVVAVRVSKVKVTVADTLTMELEASVEEGFEVAIPDPGHVMDDFEIRDSRYVGQRLDADGNIARLMRYRIAPMSAGVLEIPAFVFEFGKEGEDQTFQISTEAIKINVVSLLDAGEAATVAEEDEGVVQLAVEISWWWYIAGGVIVIAIIAIIAVVVLRRCRDSEIERIYKGAHELAYERLSELERQGYVEAGMLKEFYEGVSNVLRYYIEDRFTLKAPEHTTEEFLYELQYSYVLSTEDKDSVGQFLRHCDLVKFARQEPTEVEVNGSVKLVKGFVDRTRSDESVVEIFEKGN